MSFIHRQNPKRHMTLATVSVFIQFVICFYEKKMTVYIKFKLLLIHLVAIFYTATKQHTYYILFTCNQSTQQTLGIIPCHNLGVRQDWPDNTNAIDEPTHLLILLTLSLAVVSPVVDLLLHLIQWCCLMAWIVVADWFVGGNISTSSQCFCHLLITKEITQQS